MTRRSRHLPVVDRDGCWIRDPELSQDARTRGWAVDVWLVIRRGQLVVGELRVYPLGQASTTPGTVWRGAAADVPPSGVQRGLLSKIPIGRIGAVSAAWLSAQMVGPDRLAPAVVTRMLPRPVAARKPRRRRRAA